MQYSGTVFVAAITHWTFFQLQNRIPFELRIPYYFFFLSCFGRSLCTALVGEQSGGSNTKFYVCVYCMRELWSWRALSGAHYQQQPRASCGAVQTPAAAATLEITVRGTRAHCWLRRAPLRKEVARGVDFRCFFSLSPALDWLCDLYSGIAAHFNRRGWMLYCTCTCDSPFLRRVTSRRGFQVALRTGVSLSLRGRRTPADWRCR